MKILLGALVALAIPFALAWHIYPPQPGDDMPAAVGWSLILWTNLVVTWSVSTVAARRWIA